MMVFFDTNVLIYALCKNVDNIKQQDISARLIEKAIENQNLLLSDVLLCEFAFVSKKLKEDEEVIIQNLKFLSNFTKTSKTLNKKLIDILGKTKLFNSSFDIYHLSFCEEYDSKLITFDKGFKKFQNISKVEIEILTL